MTNYPGLILAVLLIASTVSAQSVTPDDESYLNWTLKQAQEVGRSSTKSGTAGGFFDTRIISTNRAINYRVRATLFTPEVIRASARYRQLLNRLTDDETRTLVNEAENAGHLVIVVEINPNEGSGVIPLDWRAFLLGKGSPTRQNVAVQAVKSPQLKKIVALNPVLKRDYEYDIFWLSFPVADDKGSPLIHPDSTEIQLVVGIYNKETTVTWSLTESLRKRIRSLTSN